MQGNDLMADNAPLPDEAPSFAHFCQDDDEMRRCYILEMFCDPQVDAKILVENMARVEAWLKAGTVEKAQPSLKVVNKKVAE
jgi:hypothetical protein